MAKRRRVVAVANQKGGVGKSTVTMNTCAALAETGADCLLIDFDPQGHSSLICGQREVSPRYGTAAFKLLQHDIPLDELIRPTDYGFDIVPGGVDVTTAEMTLTKMDKLECVRTAIEAITIKQYDYIFIDCPPSVSGLTQAAIVAADGVLIPLPLTGLALDGMGLLMQTMRGMRRYNPKVDIDGAVVSVAYRKTRHGEAVRREVNRQLPSVLFTTEIRSCTKVCEAADAGKPILAYAPKEKVCFDIRAFAAEYVARVA